MEIIISSQALKGQVSKGKSKVASCRCCIIYKITEFEDILHIQASFRALERFARISALKSMPMT